MKNLTIGLITATAVFLLSAMAVMAADEAFPITPNPVGPGNYGPDAYLAYRAIDIGIDVAGDGSTINPTDIRNSNYAFTGEKIYYYVLVRDDNGAADITTVKWLKDGSAEMGPCVEVPVFIDASVGGGNPPDESLGAYFCPNGLCDGTTCSNIPPPQQEVCDRPEYRVYIDEATNLNWDDQTDKIYRCILTVESGWGGSDPAIKVQATDQGGATGATLSENWVFNPPLSVSLVPSSGSTITWGQVQKDQAVPGVTEPNCLMNIGENLVARDCTKYNPTATGAKLCDVTFSTNKLILTNTGIPDLWPFIAADNFYASTGMANCPFSNELVANQFEYRSVQGSWDSGWRVMPQYSPNLGCKGVDLINSQCRGGCRITEGCPINVLSPSHSIETQLKIVWPTPCIGTFDTGTIYAIVRAV
jgi:hypothetical protein